MSETNNFKMDKLEVKASGEEIPILILYIHA